MIPFFTLPDGKPAPSELYDSRVPAAFVAGWDYNGQTVTATVVDDILQNWDPVTAGIDFVSNLPYNVSFFVSTGGIPLSIQSQPVRKGKFRVKGSIAFESVNPIDWTIFRLDSSIVADIGDGTGDGSFDNVIEILDESDAFIVLQIPTATEGDVVALNLSFEEFPPALKPIEYTLNPHVPFHRVLLAVPDDSFAFLAKCEFLNGGALQTQLEIAVGPISGRFIVNPPVADIEAPMSEDNIHALFEWASVADKLRISFSDYAAGEDVTPLVTPPPTISQTQELSGFPWEHSYNPGTGQNVWADIVSVFPAGPYGPYFAIVLTPGVDFVIQDTVSFTFSAKSLAVFAGNGIKILFLDENDELQTQASAGFFFVEPNTIGSEITLSNTVLQKAKRVIFMIDSFTASQEWGEPTVAITTTITEITYKAIETSRYTLGGSVSQTSKGL